MDIADYLRSLSQDSEQRFRQDRSVLSFADYMGILAAEPGRLSRSAAQYLKDAIDFYGSYEMATPAGPVTRFAVFDAPFDRGRDRLVGQEEVQTAFYGLLSSIVREGRSSRFILLHGPNGSAKTSFIQCLARTLVHYSHTDPGAAYSFSWIFPRQAATGRRVGFEQGAPPAPARDTYAYSPQDDIAAVVPSELRDPPLFLLPKGQRAALLESLAREVGLPPEFRFSSHVLDGDLGPVSRKIYDTLLTAYGGDVLRVLAHVRVERFHYSRRYRHGIVTIEPQMHVDAHERQVTMDESYASLPAILRHQSLSQLSGDLVDANRGLIEYNDLLKRPVESFKYLLGTCESSRVPVGNGILYLDLVFAGTSNDKYVHAFAKLPEFPSFKGRMEFVRVPYIRSYKVEQDIYDMQVSREVVGRHVAPHATHVAALWAVLTRLKKPDPEYYPPSVASVVGKLSPLEKADLYALGAPPPDVRPEVAREMVQQLPRMLLEGRDRPDYEGGFGASPREIKALLLSAAQFQGFQCLHPVRVLDEILELTKHTSLYEFLQHKPSGDFNDPVALWSRVSTRYGQLVEREFMAAMGLVTDDEFERQMQKYAVHASAFLKKENVVDPVSRQEIPPDSGFLEGVETLWQISEGRARARQDFMGRIASFYLDNPGRQPLFRLLFPDQFEKLRRGYYDRIRPEYERTLRLVGEHLSGMPQDPHDATAAKAVVDNLISRFGYCPACVGPAVSFLVNESR
jgi:predicted Ser/Thr protein kinase